MKNKYSETRSKRTWFGANASVTIGPGFLHKAGFDGLVIPHPPLANWLLRLGLPDPLKRSLTESRVSWSLAESICRTAARTTRRMQKQSAVSETEKPDI